MRILNSFYAKLTLVFLVLIVGLGILLAILGVRSAYQYTMEVEQQINYTLAEDLAPRFEPLMQDSINHAAVSQEINDLTGINRRIEIYVLESDGTIKASFADSEASIDQWQVDTDPIDRFLAGEDLPIMGDDPLHPDRSRAFSVAPISIMDDPECYLYIVLTSGEYASTASMLQNSYIVQSGLVGMGAIILVAGILGVFLFYRLTRRLRSMTDVVARFESEDFEPRMEEQSNDELGQLARCFNQMADTLTETMDELRRADKMRRELVANVSHDLRSPLASVQGYLETVLIKEDSEKDALPPSKRKEYLETALHNTERLNKLVKELFELSKLDAKQVEPEMDAFPLAELAQDLVMQSKPQAEKQDIELEAEFSEGLERVQADVALIERALSNLIDNALNYTPEGGEVRVKLSQENGSVRAHVVDTGPGIPEEDLPRIFNRFHRVEKSRDRDSGGAGLGLAITQKILELHDSKLQVESEVGRGTDFSFALPAEGETENGARSTESSSV